MTSASLQLLALCTMLVDHVGLTLFPGVFWLRWIGRVSFPVFLFLLSEGFSHTSSRRNYALRLGVFAVISEAPYQFLIWTVYGGSWQLPFQNVFFELLTSFFAIWCASRGRYWLLGTAGAVVVAEILGMDYGGYGVLLAVCFWLLRGKPWAQVMALAACTALYCVAHHNITQAWAVLAALPVALYTGERGRRLPRYTLYVFYPAHLAVLGAVRYFLF